MNETMLNKIGSVINALNGIDVKGKNNLMNLGGCIAILEELYQDITALQNKENNKAQE
jgi:hypothetical protein